MRAVWVREYTDFDRLTVEDVAAPGPLDARQVRIDIRAAGISYAANLVVTGKYQRKPPLPFAPGTECAGVIAECGSGITRFKPGDRVCATLDWGAYAEQAVAWECNVFALPQSMSFPEATNFNSYATATAALSWPHLLDVRPGETLLVHGAAGAVGLAGVEIGKIRGATVIATASTAEKRQVARDHGADHVIDYSDGEFRAEVNEITQGRGADAILDPVGGDVFDQSLRCIALQGRIAPVGFTAGRISQAPVNILLLKNISVRGLNMGAYYGWSPTDLRWEMEPRVRALLDDFTRWFEQGRIRPHVCATYRLDDFKDAMNMVLERRSTGRVALVMG